MRILVTESPPAPLNSETRVLYRVTWPVAATVVPGQSLVLIEGTPRRGDFEAVRVIG